MQAKTERVLKKCSLNHSNYYTVLLPNLNSSGCISEIRKAVETGHCPAMRQYALSDTSRPRNRPRQKETPQKLLVFKGSGYNVVVAKGFKPLAF